MTKQLFYGSAVASLVLLATTATWAQEVTPGALYDFRAANNPGDPDSFTNLGTLGGSLGVSGTAPTRTLGDIAYYDVQAAPGAWDGLGDGAGGVDISNGTFSYEILLRRTGDGFGSSEHQVATIAEGRTTLFLDFKVGGSNDGLDMIFNDGNGHGGWKFDLFAAPLNEWVHSVITFDQWTGMANVYIDGGAPSTIDLSADGLDYTGATDENAVTLFKVRGREADNRRFDGDISVARLYDFVLDQQQVQDNYLAAIPEPSSIGLAGFGLLSLALAGRRRRR